VLLRRNLTVWLVDPGFVAETPSPIHAAVLHPNTPCDVPCVAALSPCLSKHLYSSTPKAGTMEAVVALDGFVNLQRFQ